jgi:hypothetical protein
MINLSKMNYFSLGGGGGSTTVLCAKQKDFRIILVQNCHRVFYIIDNLLTF